MDTTRRGFLASTVAATGAAVTRIWHMRPTTDTIIKRCPPIRRSGSSRSNRCWSRKAWWIRRPWMQWSIFTSTRSGRATARASSRRRGSIRLTSSDCSPIPTGHRGAGIYWSARRTHGCGREHRQGTQSRRLHSLLLLPVSHLGLPPVWYKSAAYRSRAVIDPRGVLREFGVELPDDVEVRVWDSTADLRYLVLPERPAGTDGLSEDALAALVTRDSMIGVAKVMPPQREAADEWIHDMGGMQDMGAILYEKNEPVFHAPWEGRVYGDDARRAGDRQVSAGPSTADRELPPAQYLSMRYYELWLTSLIERLVASGLVTREEIETGKPAQGSPKSTLRLPRPTCQDGLPRERRRDGTQVVPPLFKVGAAVRARNINPVTHTRLPRYVRGKSGTIDRGHGVFVFQDTAAYSKGEKPQHVYSVRFAARDLWGEQAAPQDSVYLDLCDDYLEPI